MVKKSEVSSEKSLTIMCLSMPLGLIFLCNSKTSLYICVESIQIFKKRGEREMNVNGSVDFSLIYSLL